jgi:phage terminase large subunit-like protein
MVAVKVAEVLREIPPEKLDTIMQALKQLQKRVNSPFERLFPDENTRISTGEIVPDAPFGDPDIIYARRHYPKHMEFFAATKEYREVALMAGNRIGKTTAAAYALTVWLTGRYPPWWPGRVFKGPIAAWAAGKTNESTRDIVQATLLGAVQHSTTRRYLTGDGMVPGDCLAGAQFKSGVQDLVDTVSIRHESGRLSTLGLKAYAQGRGTFEGTAQHCIWTDEEPPEDVYNECLVRTATTDGIMLATFTPLDGMTNVAIGFLPADQRPATEEEKDPFTAGI